jgi:hypothetical protein
MMRAELACSTNLNVEKAKGKILGFAAAASTFPPAFPDLSLLSRTKKKKQQKRARLNTIFY